MTYGYTSHIDVDQFPLVLSNRLLLLFRLEKEICPASRVSKRATSLRHCDLGKVSEPSSITIRCLGPFSVRTDSIN